MEFEKIEKQKMESTTECQVTQDILDFYYKNQCSNGTIEQIVKDKTQLNNIIKQCILAQKLKIKTIDVLAEALANKNIIDNYEHIWQLLKLTRFKDYKWVLDYNEWINNIDVFEQAYSDSIKLREWTDRHLDSEMWSIESLIGKLWKFKLIIEFIN